MTGVRLYIMHVSGGMKQCECIKLDRGANVNSVNNTGCTPLFYMVSKPAGISILIQRNADPNIQASDGDTALHCLMMDTEDTEIVQHLLDNGADIFALNENGETPADVATRCENTVVAAYLVERMEGHRVLQGTQKNAMTAEDS
jgi:ankyrin repeat protein